MAQVVVDSAVMRDKARSLENAAVTIDSLYAEMLREVTTTSNKMRGTTVETSKKQFASMQPTFDTIVKDMKAYGAFLIRQLKAMRQLSVQVHREPRSREKSSKYYKTVSPAE